MRDVNKLVQTIEELDGEAEALRGGIARLTARYPELKRDAEARYEALRSEISQFLSMTAAMRANLCELYPQYLSESDGKLLYAGRLPAAAATDCDGCFGVYEAAVKSIYDGAAALLNGISVEENCRAICGGYAAIRSIFAQIDGLRAERDKKIDAACNAEYAELDKKLRLSEASAKEAEDALAALVAAQGTETPPTLLRLPATFGERIFIPLGISRLSGAAAERYGDALGGISSRAEWDLSEEGVVHLAAGGCAVSSAEFFEIVKTLLLRFAFCYPAAAKRIAVCDNSYDERLISFAGALSESVPSLFLHGEKSVVTENSEAEIAATLGEIGDTISRRLVLVGRAGLQNIVEYNFRNADNVQPLILVLLHGYPRGFGQAAEILSGLFKNGKKAGVFFLVTDGAEGQERGADRLPAIGEIADMRLEIGKEDGAPSFTLDGAVYKFFALKEEDGVQASLAELRAELARNENAVPLSAVLPAESFATSLRRRAFSKILSLPVGKNGAKIFSLDLDAEGDAHVLISGTTGSGKSSLINTLVLSAALLYAPSEVEIHMISIIKSEFKIFAERQLPHLKTLITEDNVVGANDVLDYLVNEMQKRQNLIGSKGDIVNYNASAPAEKKLPRSIIVIDEYQQLIGDDRAREKMNKIAQLGRSCGMCLVLSSQSVPVEFRNSIDLFRHRFEFSASGDLIPESVRRKNELEALKGLCFYGRGNAVDLVRIAYPGKDGEIGQTLNGIAARYPEAQMRLRSEISPIVAERGSDIPSSLNAVRDYREEGVCKIRLGRKYLSATPVEFPLGYKNSLLCLCGEYLLTKQTEAAIVSEVLSLSEGVDGKTVYYIDFNRNPNWARKSNPVKEMRDEWTLNAGGRFAFFAAGQAMDALGELEALARQREEHAGDETQEIYPVVVLLTCVDRIADDSDECYAITSLMEKGKNNNIFFVMQFNEFSRSANAICDKIYLIRDAVIVPDRYYDDETYTSAGVVDFLSETEAADGGAKDLLRALRKTPLNRNLHILCLNNEVSCYIPYGHTRKYFLWSLRKEESDV